MLNGICLQITLCKIRTFPSSHYVALVLVYLKETILVLRKKKGLNLRKVYTNLTVPPH